ncbi:MAG: hypothetical protein R6U32_01655 [Candidatus Woesearchaeota archaeon]
MTGIEFILDGEQDEISRHAAEVVAGLAGIKPETARKGISRDLGCRDIYRKRTNDCLLIEVQLYEGCNLYGLMVSRNGDTYSSGNCSRDRREGNPIPDAGSDADNGYVAHAQRLADNHLREYMVENPISGTGRQQDG